MPTHSLPSYYVSGFSSFEKETLLCAVPRPFIYFTIPPSLTQFLLTSSPIYFFFRNSLKLNASTNTKVAKNYRGIHRKYSAIASNDITDIAVRTRMHIHIIHVIATLMSSVSAHYSLVQIHAHTHTHTHTLASQARRK